MAIIEVSNLLRAVSRQDALSDLLVLAKSLKFTPSSWRIGSRHRFWILAVAEVYARCSVQIALIAAQGFNSTAYGTALGKFSKSRFDNPRAAAIKTQGTILLMDAGGTGPHTIAVGSRVFKYDNDPSITYRNITGGVVPLSGSVELTIEAETGGSAHNVDVDTISSMSPVIAGVDVSNPGTANEWITRSGVDEEPDPTLKQRNTSKWATLGGGVPRGAYEYWALNANEEIDDSGDPVGISRVAIDDQNPDGPGTVFIYVADDTGTASGAQVTDVQEYINARKQRTDVPTVLPADPFPVSVVGTFRCAAGLGASLKTQIQEEIADYINSVPIGGTDIGETMGVVVWSRIVEEAMAIDGVEQVAVTTINGIAPADVALQPEQVATVGGVTFTALEI